MASKGASCTSLSLQSWGQMGLISTPPGREMPQRETTRQEASSPHPKTTR